MDFDPEALAAYRVADVHQTYGARDCALYAISVGFGRDAVAPLELRFADHTRSDHIALPSMALVLGYPGFWLAQAGTTADPALLLHGEQEIHWHRPLPTSGQLIGRTRLLSVIDRGAKSHALIRSERKLVDAVTGSELATLVQTHVLRGKGGFSATTGTAPPPHPIAAGPAPHALEVATRAEQALLYRLNGDSFALHSDPDVAARAGFAKPILHGMCTAGIALGCVLRTLANSDPQRFAAARMRFANPVYPGDVIRTEMWDDGSFQASVPARDIVVIANGHVELA